MALQRPHPSGLTAAAIAWIENRLLNHPHVLRQIRDYVAGGGGMVEHDNTFHDPDYATITSLNSHTSSTSNPHSTSDANLVTTDVATNDASTTKHGFLKKLSNVATEFMNGQGNWAVPVGSGNVVVPNYEPPLFKYKDADEITLRAGRYHVAGYRHRGQYQEPSATYWDLATSVDVDVDATYSAGVTSGMIGGAEVVSSFYSLFLMNSSGIVLVLPVVRIKAISYGAPSTTINPGDHDTGAANENGFITANDAWNNYRLVKWSYDAYDGTVYTIADTVDGTPDQILITGDKTGELAVGDGLQLIPPDGTDCVYLGYIRIHSDGTIYQFQRKPGWKTIIWPWIRINGNNDTAPGNTSLWSGVPPMAEGIWLGVYVASNGANSTAVRNVIYAGSSGTDIVATPFHAGATFNNLRFESIPWIPLTAVSQIRNAAQYYDGAAWQAAGLSYLDVMGTEE